MLCLIIIVFLFLEQAAEDDGTRDEQKVRRQNDHDHCQEK